MDDLFEVHRLKPSIRTRPLAVRLSPQTLDDLVGQSHIIAPGRLLRRLIESDALQSVVFYGPSGTGKTALARIIARMTKSHFHYANAVTLGVPELRKILDAAKKQLSINNKQTILLIDEIHHFNRSQQDALLPDVEEGNIIFIGITTENPFFYVNAALLSRAQAFEFFPLKSHDMEKILKNALQNTVHGYPDTKISVSDEAAEHFILHSSGDARRMLNALEVAVATAPKAKDGSLAVTLTIAEEATQKKALSYDKKSDAHYDTISAFIKSMRGSDPDAALYWMAKMLAAGEDPLFIIRRIIICASEDVGNADPQALILATSALQALEFIGMPEGRIILGHAAVYVACAPKSNASYMGIEQALQEVKKGKLKEVPNHLKDANLDRDARGHGIGYKYAHDYPGHFVVQEYLPGKAAGRLYYKPTELGQEKEISRRLQELDKLIAEEKKEVHT
ncbi:MAG: replication-associated recombination protein A [bacterium]